MRVGTDQELAGLGEPLEVDVVRDAIAGAGVEDAVASTERLQVAVLVHVLVVDLQDVVVDVHHRQRDGDPICSKRFELEGGHGAGGVLDQDLVDVEVDLLPGNEVAPQQIVAEQLSGKIERRHACHTLLSARNVVRAGSLKWATRALTTCFVRTSIPCTWTRSSTSRRDASLYPRR